MRLLCKGCKGCSIEWTENTISIKYLSKKKQRNNDRLLQFIVFPFHEIDDMCLSIAPLKLYQNNQIRCDCSTDLLLNQTNKNTVEWWRWMTTINNNNNNLRKQSNVPMLKSVCQSHTYRMQWNCMFDRLSIVSRTDEANRVNGDIWDETQKKKHLISDVMCTYDEFNGIFLAISQYIIDN